MRHAHRLGMSTTATMMYGHVETRRRAGRAHAPDPRAPGRDARLPRLHLVDVPGRRQPPRRARCRARRMPTSFDYLLTQAVSRIYLDNVDHIQSSWVTQGMKIGQVALEFGADDLGSIMIEENVVSAAGTTYRASTDDFVRTIKGAREDPGAARHALPRRPRLELAPRSARRRPASLATGSCFPGSPLLAVLAAALAGGCAAAPPRRRRGRADAGRHLREAGPVHAARAGRLHVITAPRPRRPLRARARARARHAVTAGPRRVTRSSARLGGGRDRRRHQRRLLQRRTGHPSGIVIAERRAPARAAVRRARRSGSTRAATLHVERISFVGTWKGTRPAAAARRASTRRRSGDQVVLFTPAWGAATPNSRTRPRSCSSRSRPRRRTPT